MDTTILNSTVRTEEEQAEYLLKGKSQTMNSMHLEQEDGWVHAIDASPYPIDWRLEPALVKLLEAQGANYSKTMKEVVHNIKRWYYWRGLIDGAATVLDSRVRGGHDWDGDTLFNDQKFDDLVHTELVKDE
jgi:hypothetical protein